MWGVDSPVTPCSFMQLYEWLLSYPNFTSHMAYSKSVPYKVSTWEEVGKEEQEVTAGRSDWTAATGAAGVRISWKRKKRLVIIEIGGNDFYVVSKHLYDRELEILEKDHTIWVRRYIWAWLQLAGLFPRSMACWDNVVAAVVELDVWVRPISWAVTGEAGKVI